MAALTVIEALKFTAALTLTTAAVLTAVGVVAKSKYIGRPARWLWRRNISDPIGGWARHNVRAVVDDRINYLMSHNNGGSSLKDLADSQKKITQQVATLLEHDRLRDTEGKRYAPNEGDTE